MHVFVFDAVAEIFYLQGVLLLGDDLFGIQDLEDALRRGHAFLHVVVALRERLGRGDDLREHHDIADETARVDVVAAAEDELAAKPQHEDDHGGGEELAHRGTHVALAVDATQHFGVVAVLLLKLVFRIAYGIEGLDDA